MNRIKELRQLHGYTQDGLSKLLNCTGMTISRYESEKSSLDTDTINKLCSIFNCTSDYLLGRTDEPTAQLPRGPELKSELHKMISELSADEEAIVKGFIAGLKARRE